MFYNFEFIQSLKITDIFKSSFLFYFYQDFFINKYQVFISLFFCSASSSWKKIFSSVTVIISLYKFFCSYFLTIILMEQRCLGKSRLTFWHSFSDPFFHQEFMQFQGESLEGLYHVLVFSRLRFFLVLDIHASLCSSFRFERLRDIWTDLIFPQISNSSNLTYFQNIFKYSSWQ